MIKKTRPKEIRSIKKCKWAAWLKNNALLKEATETTQSESQNALVMFSISTQKKTPSKIKTLMERLS